MDGCMSFRRGGGGREGGESGFEIARSVHENKGEFFNCMCVWGGSSLWFLDS